MNAMNSSTGGSNGVQSTAVTTAQHVGGVEGLAMAVSGVPMEGDNRVVRRSARLASLSTVCYKKFFGGRRNNGGRRRMRRRAGHGVAGLRRSRRVARLEPVVVVQAEQRSRRMPEPQVVLAEEHDNEAFDFVEEEEEQPQMAMVVHSPPLLEQVTADLAVEQGRWVYCVFLETVEEEEEQPQMAMVVHSPPPCLLEQAADQLAVEEGRWVFCVFLETVEEEEEEEQPQMAMVVYSPPLSLAQLVAAAAAKAEAEAEVAAAAKAEAEAEAAKAKAEAEAAAAKAKAVGTLSLHKLSSFWSASKSHAGIVALRSADISLAGIKVAESKFLALPRSALVTSPEQLRRVMAKVLVQSVARNAQHRRDNKARGLRMVAVMQEFAKAHWERETLGRKGKQHIAYCTHVRGGCRNLQRAL